MATKPLDHLSFEITMRLGTCIYLNHDLVALFHVDVICGYETAARSQVIASIFPQLDFPAEIYFYYVDFTILTRRRIIKSCESILLVIGKEWGLNCT